MSQNRARKTGISHKIVKTILTAALAVMIITVTLAYLAGGYIFHRKIGAEQAGAARWTAEAMGRLIDEEERGVPVLRKGPDEIGRILAETGEKWAGMLVRRLSGGESRVILAGADGTVRWHSGSDLPKRQDHDADELRKIEDLPEGWGMLSGLEGHKTTVVLGCAPIPSRVLREAGEKWWVFVENDLGHVFAPANNALRYVILFMLLPMAIIFVSLRYFLWKIVLRPITELQSASGKIAEGELNYSISLDTDDEIGDLAGSLRAMVVTMKEKQMAVLREKEYTDNIISSMIDTLIVVDSKGVIRLVNKATLDLLGYAEEELIGQRAETIFARDEKKEMEEKNIFSESGFERLRRERSVYNEEMVYRTKTGMDIPVTLCGSVMYESGTETTKLCDDTEEGDISGRRMIGVVSIARDMRQIRTLISDLRESKKEMEALSLKLEQKIDERVKYLMETQEASLNVLEDLQLTKEELEESNAELKAAKEAIEGFSRGLEEKVKERTLELSIIYEVSNAMSYALDYQQLMKLIMESLLKVTDYDICAALLFDRDSANITMKMVYPESADFVDTVKNNLIEDTARLAGMNIRKKRISFFLLPTRPGAGRPKEGKDFTRLRSNHNVPFIVRGETIGMLNVSSCRENAFSDEEVRIIYTIANQASNAIERLQAVITAEKSKMESMVESMAEGVIMTDARREIVVLNPQARRMLGFGAEEEVDSKALNEKLKGVALDGAIEECQREQQLVVRELVFPGRENQIMRSETTPVKGADDAIIGMVTILRDITHRKELEKRERLAQLGKLVADMAHEVNNPLMIISGRAQLSLMEELKDEQIRENLEIVVDQSLRAKNIILRLLKFSKPSKGEIELMDVNRDLEEVISIVEHQYSLVGIEIKRHYADGLPPIYADEKQIQEVMMNLLNNAYEAITGGGVVEVITGREGDFVRIDLKDTGCGITREVAEKMFDPFFTTKEKGTGLGLSMCYSIIKAHNGELKLDGAPGKGTTATILLPVKTEKPDIGE
ncbi:MAG: ATP-binding protein [Candidatus Omnitrophota bacterium]